MENFLLTFTPISTITVATALYKHADSGSWSGDREQEVQRFVEILENIKNMLKRIPREEGRLRKLQSFGTGESLRQRVSTAIDDMYSLVELNVLVIFTNNLNIVYESTLIQYMLFFKQIDAIGWREDANANINSLKREVIKRTKETSGYEKQMWERVETELHDIKVGELGFDHPLCSGILDIRSEPFTKMPTSLCNIFKEPFQKYKLKQNNTILNMCKEFVKDEEGKIGSKGYDIVRNVEFGKWVDQPEKLEQMTREILEAMGRIWRSPKYKSFTKNKKPQVNEGSYVCEVIAPLINIVMNDLPGDPSARGIWGEQGSLASATRKGSRKIARRPDYMLLTHLGKKAELEIFYLETGRPDSTLIKRAQDHKKLARFSKDSVDTTRNVSTLQRIFNKSITRQQLAIFTVNVAGDVLEIYAMRKETGIFKYCILDQAPIPLHIATPNDVYRLIHTLLTLRTAVACTLYKILHKSEEGDSDFSAEESPITVTTPKDE
ncbi:7966_t:CDS:2 [Diversispora eburnea]|uniref:7966_t:CDS:1 n=1 Tax=Diversispora eburnea TaxID=1213867 RepID=A0A9N9D971_9GLOM|nr:7966_t:CDS:2 [Diversispora eburnea]